jgi:NAD-dependent dihydropyrimidine dehydrogenase PreA subunit
MFNRLCNRVLSAAPPSWRSGIRFQPVDDYRLSFFLHAFMDEARVIRPSIGRCSNHSLRIIRVLKIERGVSTMPNTLTRRSFIKAGLLSAGAVAIAGVPHPRAAGAAEAELCTLLDLQRCIACGACVEACRETNEEKFPEPAGPMPDMIPRSKVKIADWSSPENGRWKTG